MRMKTQRVENGGKSWIIMMTSLFCKVYNTDPSFSCSLRTLNISRKTEHMKGIMQTSCLLSVLLVTLLSVWSVLGNDSLLPPNRPSHFRSPGQLRQYLKALNDYYAIVGRPRFGKRDSEFSLNDQEPASDGLLLSGRDRGDYVGQKWW